MKNGDDSTSAPSDVSTFKPIQGYAGRSLMPRLVRMRDAPYFFGMDKNRFNREIRPLLTEIRVGKQGRAFDRLEMEAAAEDYKDRNGRPAADSERIKPWETADRQASSSVVGSGISTKCSEARAFARALQQATLPKPKSSLRDGLINSATQASTGCGSIAPFARQPRSS